MTHPPKKLAIYYGWPSSLNSATNGWNLNNVATDMAQYDIFVLGAGLQDSGHGDHTNTVMILGNPIVANTEFYGYVTTTDTLPVIESKIDDWKTMGGQLKGIFVDEFSIARNKQNDIIDYIHGKGLKAFVNAWDPDDVFSGAPAHKLNTDDWYLAENYQIINGSYETESNWLDKSNKMESYSSEAKMATIATAGAGGFSQAKFDYCYFSTIYYNFAACGWAENNYSAGDAVMPFRTRKALEGTKIKGDKISASNTFERMVNVGIHVDTSAHTVSSLLN